MRLRNIEIRPGAIDLFLSRGKILGQGSASIENRTRQDGLSLLSTKISLFHRDIERHQNRAGLHDVPRSESHLAHGPGQFIAQGNGTERQYCSDRCRGLMMVNSPGYSERHDFHRLRLVR